jgi:16S rRNA (guanine(966)-N(2))-methyltransferase RsmD
MRIIAGSKRGMTLLSPKTDSSRPITDRVKESLFNVLYNYGLPSGEVVADLFCGVGSLGLEALSRGAKFVTFVEKDERIIATLKKNIEKAGFVKDSKVVRANAFTVGAAIGAGGTKCKLAFVDPPYAATDIVGSDSPLASLLDVLGGQVIDDAMVIVRTRSDVTLLNQYRQFRVAERRTWGTMAITILTNAKDAIPEDDKQTGSDQDY